MKIPNIKARRIWNAESVRKACTDNCLYTNGTNEEYGLLLEAIDTTYPDYENVYLVAMNITNRSDDQTISNVMFILENQAIKTAFEIED